MADEKLRRLFDLQNQQLSDKEKSVRLGHFSKTPIDELGKIIKWACGIFGNHGTRRRSAEWGWTYGRCIEAGPEEPGIVYVGYYIDPPSLPSHRRRRKLVFRGRTHRDFVDQAKVFFS